jgi:ATP-dependent exoDNAse (exonuclease V) beta subunit
MDLLNLIYVAFTRPCNWLCVYATMPAITKEEVRTKGNWINHLEMLMPNLGLELTDSSTDTVRTFQFGDPYGSKESEKAPTLILSLKDYPLFPLPELHLPEIAQTSEQKGRLLHDFLARLQKPHHAMMELETWPVYKTLSSETQKSLQQQLSNLLGMPEFLELYEDALQVFSERDFFSPEGLLRPDRVVVRSEYAVVVDFKTGTVRPEHEQQVRRYGQYLTQLLQKPVKGLILYSANATSISLS